MDFEIGGSNYFIILVIIALISAIGLVAVWSKNFIINQYYTLIRIFDRVAKIYAWLYSIFFDSVEDFERKYSRFSSYKYKKKRQQQSYSFYTDFNQKSKYKNFNKQSISNNSFTNDSRYNQFFLDSDYEILGVPYKANFRKVIRPAYIELINKYHEDKMTTINKIF